MSAAYEREKKQYQKYFAANTGRSGKEEEIRTTPLFSLKVKHLIDHAQTKSSRSSSDGSASSDARPRQNGFAAPSYASSTSGDSSAEDSSSYLSSSEEDVEGPSCGKELAAILPQYGLLGHHVGQDEAIGTEEPILLNVNAPNSAFICGSQGSGKSYTLSCMLENCLIKSAKVDRPVAGVVFQYDSNSTPTVAEAAYLCSRGVKVDVFISPCNPRLGNAYRALGQKYGNVNVQPLLLRSSDLDVERINKLMAVSESEGKIPLYLELVQKILRDMARTDTFSYANFKQMVEELDLSRDQRGPMNQRIALLESFMNERDVAEANRKSAGKPKKNFKRNDHLFELRAGSLTIIDLTDTFVDASTACILFDICLGLIQEQRPASGLVVTLDEAHRFLSKTSTAAATFTESLLTTIRTQRHTATRVIIATQEPTISERLLDLCSMSIIHRFSSPAWFAAIKDHLCGASKMVQGAGERDEMFERIVGLNVGESLVFSPSAFVRVEGEEEVAGKLGARAIKMKTRRREGVDGGMSLLADQVGELGV